MSDAALIPLVTRSLASASVLEWGILIVLGVLSLLSWAVMIEKFRALRRLRVNHHHFRQVLGEVSHLGEVETRIAGRSGPSLFQAVFQAGLRAHRQSPPDPASVQAGSLSLYPVHEPAVRIRLAMEQALIHARQDLQRHLPFLATTASAAPFIGLLGTVWGIMGTFQTLGDAKSASLQVLAPPIAAALIATAAGLAVAIPAVMAFQFFTAGLQDEEESAASLVDQLSHLLAPPTAISTPTAGA